MGREGVSAIHEVHEPFGKIISLHAASWDVGGGGACTEMLLSSGSRFILHPEGENVKTDSTPGNNFL